MQGRNAGSRRGDATTHEFVDVVLVPTGASRFASRGSFVSFFEKDVPGSFCSNHPPAWHTYDAHCQPLELWVAKTRGQRNGQGGNSSAMSGEGMGTGSENASEHESE